MADVIEEARIAAADREMKDPEVIRRIGMAALKFFIIKVDPRKRMTFDPKASVDLQGKPVLTSKMPMYGSNLSYEGLAMKGKVMKAMC